MQFASNRSLWMGLGGLVVAVALLALWRGAAQPAAQEAGPAEVQISEAGLLQLSEAQAQALQLQVEPAQAAEVVAVSGLAAEALAPLDASAGVVAAFAGVVTRVLVDEGDDVRRGQPLVRIQSREVLSAQAALAQARSEAEIARQQAERDQALLKEGIIAAARAQASRAQLAVAEGARVQAEGALSGLRLVSGTVPGEYEVLAPMDGRVLQRMVVPGQALDALAPVFSIAAPGRLDVVFNVSLALREHLSPGLQVQLPGGGSGEVVAIAAGTDRASQSLRVRARVEQPGALVAGEHFVLNLLLPAAPDAVRVPVSALVIQGDAQALYLQEPDGYRGVLVERLGGDGAHAVVTGAVRPGDQVVVRGAGALKTMLPGT